MSKSTKQSLAFLATLAALSAFSATCVAQNRGGSKPNAAPVNDAETRDKLARAIQEAAKHPVKLEEAGPGAAYVDAWVRAIESLDGGSLLRSTGGIGGAGEVLLTVDIDNDGQLRDTKVLRSSGDTAVDAAVVRVIRSAAPYAPVPREVGAVSVTRAWRPQTKLLANVRAANDPAARAEKPDIAIRGNWPQAFHDTVRYRRVAATTSPGGKRALREYHATLDIAVRERSKDATTFSWTYTHMTLNDKPLQDLTLELSVTPDGTITLLNRADLKRKVQNAAGTKSQAQTTGDLGSEELAKFAQDENLIADFYLRDANVFFYPLGITLHNDRPTDIAREDTAFDGAPIRAVDRWTVLTHEDAPARTLPLEWHHTIDPRDLARYYDDLARRLGIKVDTSKATITRKALYALDENTFSPHVILATSKVSLPDDYEQVEFVEMRSAHLDPNWKH